MHQQLQCIKVKGSLLAFTRGQVLRGNLWPAVLFAKLLVIVPSHTRACVYTYTCTYTSMYSYASKGVFLYTRTQIHVRFEAFPTSVDAHLLHRTFLAHVGFGIRATT